MNKYWHFISIKHQNKLRFLAKKSDITTNQALNNIVGFLKEGWDKAYCPYYFKKYKETKDIERMIDMITK